MYYFDDFSQKEISEKLGISRPQISRILTSAKENNIVNITIDNPFEDETKLEKALISKFKLKDALVLKNNHFTKNARNEENGKIFEEYLNSIVPEKAKFGVMSGHTISRLVFNIHHLPRKGLEIVPLMGGLGYENSGLHANSIAQRLGEISGGKNYVLNAPVVVQSRQAKEILLRESEIASVLALGQQCNLTLVGIGQINRSSTTAIAGKWTENDITELQKAGAVASVCNSFLDKNGLLIHAEVSERSIGQTLETISSSKIIAAANGKEKVDAIRAALKSGYLGVLVTDIETAKEILS